MVAIPRLEFGSAGRCHGRSAARRGRRCGDVRLLGAASNEPAGSEPDRRGRRGAAEAAETAVPETDAQPAPAPAPGPTAVPVEIGSKRQLFVDEWLVDVATSTSWCCTLPARPRSSCGSMPPGKTRRPPTSPCSRTATCTGCTTGATTTRTRPPAMRRAATAYIGISRRWASSPSRGRRRTTSSGAGPSRTTSPPSSTPIPTAGRARSTRPWAASRPSPSSPPTASTGRDCRKSRCSPGARSTRRTSPSG